MSRILPEPVAGGFPAEVLEVYRTLKAIPDEDLTVWVSLPLPGSEARPHFLAVCGDRSAFLIAASGAGSADVEEAAGLSLFSGDGKVLPPGDDEARRLRRFIAVTLDTAGSGDDAAETILGIVLFPNVAQAALDALPEALRPKDVIFLGREFRKPSVLAGFFADHTPPAWSEDILAALRSAFTPESVVPSRFSPSHPRARNLEAKLAPMLLDFDQEQWTKHRLVLSADATKAAEDAPGYGGASLVTGVAGSGKSLVLLFRACTQARLAPQSRSLVLTHNKALKMELESRFGDLGRPPNVSWHTFYSWTHRLVTERRAFPEILQYQERDRLIARLAHPVWGPLAPTQVEFLRDEFDWMQDRGLVREADYLQAERSGRVMPLTESSRRKVHETYRAYRAELARNNQEDWSGVALLAWNLIQDGALHPPEFDFIYVDEAQFFAPVWFETIRAALRPGSGRILLAADPTQGFLKRRQSWVACGLDLRGRSTKLRRCYRSTRQILEFAAEFYRQRVDDEELPDLNLAGCEELESAPPGAPPCVLRLSGKQDELGRTINEIESCLKSGCPPEHILVLIAGEQRFGPALDTFTAAFGSSRVGDAREQPAAGKVRICGINGATGLESPIVFVLGAADLLSREHDFNLKAEARAELIRDNTRRLYMAFTRAARRLVITWTGTREPPWLAEAERRDRVFKIGLEV